MNDAPKNFDNLHDKAVYHSQKYEYQPTEGKVVGTHIGAHFFTKGQRKGLAVGGTKEPLFVIETDVKENIIYAGQGKDHPGLHRKALLVHSDRSEEHTSELQSRGHLVCRLLLEKNK